MQEVLCSATLKSINRTNHAESDLRIELKRLKVHRVEINARTAVMSRHFLCFQHYCPADTLVPVVRMNHQVIDMELRPFNAPIK